MVYSSLFYVPRRNIVSVVELSYTFSVPCKDNHKLSKIVDLVNNDVRLQTFWKSSNIMAINRMGYTDHGPTHVKIVANSALKLLRLLIAKGAVPNIVKDYSLSIKDAETVVVLGSIFHDLGMVVTRENHETYSVLLAIEFLRTHLSSIYTQEELAIISSETLHAVLAHHPKQRVLTLEAGVVRVADALDMEQGRARIPFEAGKVDIHSVSALSIEKVEILEGTAKPIMIKIRMANSAGIFQIDELLKARIQNSGLEDYIHVVAEITGEKERKIVRKFEF
jgi:metal-dependent HD superfamily phosphatase/phosphodiesterase